MKQSQILAIEGEIKTTVHKAISELHHRVRPELFIGLTKQYTPKDEEGERVPSEYKRIQAHAPDVIREARELWSRLWDITLTKDAGNMNARADVVLDGEVILKDVPVPFLIYLGKKLEDVRTFITNIPTLDPAEAWEWDKQQGYWVTAPVQTNRTKKEFRVIVKAPATKEHQAVTELVTEDTVVGYWGTMKQSGALSAPEKAKYLQRVNALLEAVKVARESANLVEVQPRTAGEQIFGYIFRE